jgi:hypothetical protein
VDFDGVADCYPGHLTQHTARREMSMPLWRW